MVVLSEEKLYSVVDGIVSGIRHEIKSSSKVSIASGNEELWSL